MQDSIGRGVSMSLWPPQYLLPSLSSTAVYEEAFRLQQSRQQASRIGLLQPLSVMAEPDCSP